MDGVKSDIQNFVAECLVCQQNKVETIKTPGLLQPLSIPSQCWEDVSMDFIIGLPKSEGKSVVMVGVDRLTEYAHFCALSHRFKSRYSFYCIDGNNSKATWKPKDYCK